jgi:hypothetical protein
MHRSAARRVLPAIAVAVVLAGNASAQAWPYARGEGSIAFNYQMFTADGHYAPNGDFVDLGGSRAQTLQLWLDYGVTERLGVWAGVAYVGAKNGDTPSPVLGHSGIDDGRYHSTWQDLQVGARFTIIEDPVAVTPFIQLIIPLHGYETRGEAAPGRGLRQTTVGVNGGRAMDALPGLYVHLHYGHTFVEQYLDVETDRDNLDFEVGLQLRPRLSVRGLVGWQETHGGLNFPDDVHGSHDLFLEHDRLLDDDHLSAGLGAAFSATDSVSFHIVTMKSVSGSNTHRELGVSLGASWHFGFQ